MRKFGAKLLEVLRKGDMVLLALCVLTSVFGIVMVAASTAYDGSSRYVIIQTGALITGILLYLALTAFDIDILAGPRTLLFLFNTAKAGCTSPSCRSTFSPPRSARSPISSFWPRP